jgi:hypothetical protein
MGRMQKFSAYSQTEINKHLIENKDKKELVIIETQLEIILNFENFLCLIKGSKNKTEFTKIYENPVWCYMDKEKGWQFNTELSKELEIAYKDGKNSKLYDINRIKYIFDFKSFVCVRNTNRDPSNAMKIIRLPPIFELASNCVVIEDEFAFEVEETRPFFQLSEEKIEKIKKNDKIRFGKKFSFYFIHLFLILIFY